MVEGNAYFPDSAIRPGVLSPTETRTVCPWKGVASYYTVTVDGVVHRDAAWTYRRPWPLARRVAGRVAFWGDVDVRIDHGRHTALDGVGGADDDER
ncbi:Nucleotidyltransferase [Modestobacter sp. DSM 44400]|nr:Nucleotidyltransferase [Modestobacter sp. DSM 44400]